MANKLIRKIVIGTKPTTIPTNIFLVNRSKSENVIIKIGLRLEYFYFVLANGMASSDKKP